MAVNKVVYGTTVLVDLTADTVTPSTLMQGYTAHDKSGALITGTASAGRSYTITLSGLGNGTYCYVQLNHAGTIYYTSGTTIDFQSGDELYILCRSGRAGGTIAVNGDTVASTTSGAAEYTLELPDSDITVNLSYALSTASINVTIPSLSITTNGVHDVSDYALADVNVPTGGGDSYTRTVVVPQQTVTPNSSRMAAFTSTEYFVDGEYYVVTCDGTEYIMTAETLWSNNVVLGDAQAVWQTSDLLYPFALITDGSAREGYFATTSAHTIKVERLEFVDGPLNLIPKSVTANGTYNASSDNADGYSSVTVNVSGGMDVPVFTVVMDSDWSAAQSVTCSMTFAECRNYINDNDMALVEMSAQGDSDSVIYSASLYQGSSTEITFVMFLGGTPTNDVSIMSNGTCSFTNQPSTVTTLTATANGTYTDSLSRLYSEVTVNVPSGSSMNVQVAQSTTRVASTSYTKTASLTCSKAGTYDVYWDCFRSTTSGTSGSQLYIGGTASGSANTTFSSHAQNNHRTGVQINANQEVAVYVRSRASNYYAYCGQLTIVQTA